MTTVSWVIAGILFMWISGFELKYIGRATKYPENEINVETVITETSIIAEDVTAMPNEDGRTEYDIQVFKRMMTGRKIFVPTPPIMVLFY